VSSNSRIEKWLSNPLLLLVVGGVISGLLIPSITSQWANQQKQLEIKTDLIRRISESTEKFYAGIGFVETGGLNSSSVDLSDLWTEWVTSSSVIGSEIRAYFPATNLESDWKKFSEILQLRVYGLAVIADHPSRQHLRDDLVQVIQEYLSAGSGKDKVTFPHLASLERNKSGKIVKSGEYYTEWVKMKDMIMEKKNKMIDLILRSHIPL
jgi:hypothetical protein